MLPDSLMHPFGFSAVSLPVPGLEASVKLGVLGNSAAFLADKWLVIVITICTSVVLGLITGHLAHRSYVHKTFTPNCTGPEDVAVQLAGRRFWLVFLFTAVALCTVTWPLFNYLLKYLKV